MTIYNINSEQEILLKTLQKLPFKENQVVLLFRGGSASSVPINRRDIPTLVERECIPATMCLNPAYVPGLITSYGGRCSRQSSIPVSSVNESGIAPA